MKKILAISLLYLLVTVSSTGTANGKMNNTDIYFLLIPYNKGLNLVMSME